MAAKEPPKPERQITYQIGWKKGKIDYSRKKGKSSGAETDLTATSPPIEETAKSEAASVENSRAGSSLVSLSGVCGLIWLWSLPVVTAGIFIWLLMHLLNFDYRNWV